MVFSSRRTWILLLVLIYFQAVKNSNDQSLFGRLCLRLPEVSAQRARKPRKPGIDGVCTQGSGKTLPFLPTPQACHALPATMRRLFPWHEANPELTPVSVNALIRPFPGPWFLQTTVWPQEPTGPPSNPGAPSQE